MKPLFWQYFLAAEMPPDKAQAFFEALAPSLDPALALRQWHGLSASERKRIELCDLKRFETAMSRGVAVLEADDMPSTLGLSSCPPQALFAWGEGSAWHRPMVAVVGTRQASAYGKAAAYKFAESMAAAGVCIVSGGALGIDAAAHEGALAAGGHTVAVLGHGIDKVYPASHGPLFARIRQSGMLVSPFAVGAPSLGQRFLQRNSLIASMAHATLVVEAPSKSGALTTAAAAADLGRPVFVVPSGIHHESFRGSHRLIRDGATLVDHPFQILDALGLELPSEGETTQLEVEGTAGQVLELLSGGMMTIDQLAGQTGVELDQLLVEITLLEVEGRVVRDGPGYSLKP
ncbi:MAG: DNA-protecting protein DprA [Armatimonadetes bacterium]|nr:DNA-protecting protein DprA [Armatimonadota bacterium]